MGGFVWILMNVFQNLENVYQVFVKIWMGFIDVFVYLDIVFKMISVKILMSVLKSQKFVFWVYVVILKVVLNVCVQKGFFCFLVEEGVKICE